MGRHLVVVGLLIGAGSAPRLAAQVPGLPVRNAGIGTGIKLAVDLGWSRGALALGEKNQTSIAIGASAAAGLGPVGASVQIARFDQGGPVGAATWIGATGNLQVFGGPLVPLKITLQGGYASGERDPAAGSAGRPYRVTLGVGAALSIPIPGLGLVPWLAPRFEHAGNGGPGFSGSHGAISAGIDLRTLGGFGVRLAYDSRAGWPAADGVPSAVSLGASISFP